jgi:hypothetical protein
MSRENKIFIYEFKINLYMNSKMPIIKTDPEVTNMFSYILGEDMAAVTVFPFIYTKNNNTPKNVLNHELIHYEQYKETLIIGFPIILCINFLINCLYYCDRNIAYRKLLFEREAYENMNNYDYLKYRKRYSWIFL